MFIMNTINQIKSQTKSNCKIQLKNKTKQNKTKCNNKEQQWLATITS